MHTGCRRTWALATLALLAACDGGDGRWEAPDPGAGVERADAADSSDRGTRVVVTAAGGRVTLILPQGDITTGDVELVVRTEGSGEGLVPRSVDVMSPTMPMHGVARIPLEEAAPGTFIARAHFPMEGRWAVFVNLDADGTQNAEFQFDVSPAVSTTGPGKDSFPAPAGARGGVN